MGKSGEDENGDEDWHRYVDLMVINGSVVRLWDDKRSL